MEHISFFVGKKVTALNVVSGEVEVVLLDNCYYYLCPMSDYGSCRLFHIHNKQALNDEIVKSVTKSAHTGETFDRRGFSDMYVSYFKLRIATDAGICNIIYEKVSPQPGGAIKVFVFPRSDQSLLDIKNCRNVYRQEKQPAKYCVPGYHSSPAVA